MRRRILGMACIIALLTIAGAQAQQPPTVIPRSGIAQEDANRAYSRIESYFAMPSNNMFKIVRKDAATHTLIAKRRGIDTQTWTEWAYCKVPTAHLLDTLQDGSVTVTSKASASGNNTSLVTVTAEYVATYALGSATTTINCASTGALEKQILAAAGAESGSTVKP